MFELAQQADFLTELSGGGPLFVIMIVTIACSTTVLIIAVSVIRSVMIAKGREQTKREIAAYVAEGTINPKDAVAMIEAGKSFDAERLAAAVNRHVSVGWCGAGPTAVS